MSGEYPQVIVTAELVAEAEDAVVRYLTSSPGRRSFEDIVRHIAALKDLPGSQEEASAERWSNEDRARFSAVLVATGEAVARLIGAGIVVPASASLRDAFPAHYAFRTSLGWTAVPINNLEFAVPDQVRLGSSAREWVEDGTIRVRHPDLYLRDLPPMRDRVRVCLREAVEAYRRGLPLACVILLGAASEAAWREVGESVGAALGDSRLTALVADDKTPAIARAEKVLKALEARGVTNARIAAATGSARDWIEFLARFYADLRNYAVHRDVSRLPIDLPTAAVVLHQAHDYFAALYRLPAALAVASPPSGSESDLG